MHNVYVKDIVKLCGGKVLYGNEELELSNFCIDTRKLVKGDVYVGGTGQDSASALATKAYVEQLIGGIENGSY